MSGRYERVNARDDEEADTPPTSVARSISHIPNSPPPSFRSRESSMARERRVQVNDTLADAFDSGADDSEDEVDDTQRLVRGSGTLDSTQHVAPVGMPAPTTTQTSTGRIYGGGSQADGVFSNLAAKPERREEHKEEQPPTYEQAAADAAPPYWETTILAPGLGGSDEVYVDGMPVGSVFSFVWNGMISMLFQFPGFLLTYLLHSTHAAKNGSRAGLGITLIQSGFYMKGTGSVGGNENIGNGGGHPGSDAYADPPDPNSHDFDPTTVTTGGGSGSLSDISGSEWLAYILMIVGWFILIRSVSEYLRVRRHEQLVLQSPDRGLGIPIIAEGERAETVV